MIQKVEGGTSVLWHSVDQHIGLAVDYLKAIGDLLAGMQ